MIFFVTKTKHLTYTAIICTESNFQPFFSEFCRCSQVTLPSSKPCLLTTNEKVI